jgi:hypothetical protein
MNTKHTPEEWTIPSHVAGPDIPNLAGSRAIALVVIDEDEPIGEAEQLANARLMAAAPTLLAAVRWIADQDYLTQSADVIDRARAALRAAQG